MTDVNPMTWESFNAHIAELGAVVNILLDRGDRRKLRRLLGIYEQDGRTDIPIGEVFNTPHGALFVSRMTMSDELNQRGGTNDAPGDSRQSRLRGIEPLMGDPDQSFEMASRRAQFKVSAQALLTCIEAGRDRVFLQPGRFTRVIPLN